MEKSEINVSELCRKLGITRQTLYRYVSQHDELRKEEKKITQNSLTGYLLRFVRRPVLKQHLLCVHLNCSIFLNSAIAATFTSSFTIGNVFKICANSSSVKS